MVGEVMIDYLWLVMSVLFLISAVANGIRCFIIRKDYKVSSFLDFFILPPLVKYFIRVRYTHKYNNVSTSKK